MLKIVSTISFLLLMFLVSTFAGNGSSSISSFSDPSKSIPVVGNDFITPATNTTLQQITVVPQTLGKGQVLLRRRFSANEYGLYLGIMNSKAYSKLSAFKPTENLTISAFVSRKIYSFQTENPDQDIENVYFDGDLIYVENIAKIFYHDSVWKEIRMLDVLPCRLNVTSDPPGAPVYIDNEYQGITPLYMGAIYEPTAIIKIDLKGYFTTGNFVDLQSGVLLEKHFNLTKKDVFTDGSEIDTTPVWTPGDSGSVLEINQRIETANKKAEKIKNDSIQNIFIFISKYPPDTPKTQFETTEEYKKRTIEYNAKFNSEVDSLKRFYCEKRSRVLNGIPQMEAYRDMIKNREYTKYFDGNLLKLSPYDADSGFFPVTLTINEKEFNFIFIGKLYIPRDEAREFYSKGTGSGKVILTYKNWQVTITRQDSLQDTVKENYYIYYKGLKLKFKNVDYELKGPPCIYPGFIVNSPEYDTVYQKIKQIMHDTLLAREARGTVSVETIPSKALLSIFSGSTDLGSTSTPVIQHKLQPGTYQIVLTADGYNNLVDSLFIFKDSLIQKTYKLTHSNAFLDSVALAKKQGYRTFRNVRRVLFSSLAVTIGGIGVFFEKEAHKNFEYYTDLKGDASASEFENAWWNYKDNSNRRNFCYVLSGICCGLFVVSVPF